MSFSDIPLTGMTVLVLASLFFFFVRFVREPRAHYGMGLAGLIMASFCLVE